MKDHEAMEKFLDEGKVNEGSYEKKQLDTLGKPKDEYDKYTLQIRLAGNSTKWLSITPEVFNKIKAILTKDLPD